MFNKFHGVARKLLLSLTIGLVFVFSVKTNAQDRPNEGQNSQTMASALQQQFEEVKQTAVYENGKIASFKFTPLGESKAVTVRMEHDEPNRAMSVITEKLGRVRIIRDDNGRISKYELPDGGSLRISYDNIQGDLPFVQSIDIKFPNGKSKRLNLPRLPSTYRKVCLITSEESDVKCPKEATEAAAWTAAAVIVCASGLTPELCASTTLNAAWAVAKWYACERNSEEMKSESAS